MPKKILVTYATRGGTTQQIAETVAEVLQKKGHQTELRAVKEVASYEGFDGVVFGTAVRAGMLMPEMLKSIKKHQAYLATVPIAAFAVCLTIKEDTPENRKAVASYLEPVKKLIPLASEAVLAGGVSFARLGVFARFIIQKMAKAQEGDYRDQRKIAEWAEDVAHRMRNW